MLEEVVVVSVVLGLGSADGGGGWLVVFLIMFFLLKMYIYVTARFLTAPYYLKKKYHV